MSIFQNILTALTEPINVRKRGRPRKNTRRRQSMNNKKLNEPISSPAAQSPADIGETIVEPPDHEENEAAPPPSNTPDQNNSTTIREESVPIKIEPVSDDYFLSHSRIVNNNPYLYKDYNNVYQIINSDEGLCCSACMKPCSIVDFYNHIAKDHKMPPTEIAWGSFFTPVLLPVNHKEFPTKPAEPLYNYTPYPELEEGKDKPNPCAVAAKLDALKENSTEAMEDNTMEAMEDNTMEAMEDNTMDALENSMEPAAELPALIEIETPIPARIQTPMPTEIEAPTGIETPMATEIETPMPMEIENPVVAEVVTPVVAGIETPVIMEVETPVVAEVETPMNTQTKPSRYYCQICNMSYVRLGYLKRHLFDKHNIAHSPIRQTDTRRRHSLNRPDKVKEANLTSTSQTAPSSSQTAPSSSQTAPSSSQTAPSSSQTAPSSSQPNLDLPNEDDPDFYCRVCDRKCITGQAFRIHIRRVHNVKLRHDSIRTYRNPGITPDPHDPNLECGACERQFANGRTYFTHLKFVHDMSFSVEEARQIKAIELHPTKRRIAIYNPRRQCVENIIPDQTDPLNYCGACDRKYSISTPRHYIDIHGFVSQHGPGYRCVLCAEQLETREDYGNHLKRTHRKKLADRATVDDFKCRLCATEFTRKVDLSNHLVAIHGLNPTFKHTFTSDKVRSACMYCNEVELNACALGIHIISKHGVPFVYDQVNYCCNLCGEKSRSEIKYREHLVLTHRIGRFPDEEGIDIHNRAKPYGKNVMIGFHDETEKSMGRKLNKRKLSDEDQSYRPSKRPDIKGLDPINLRRKATSSRHSKTTNNTIDLSATHCQICDLTFNTNVHYRLHCYKYH
ncbi:uncharacterized protein EV154DRAFT_600119 [Mucor mucedo]|uniref:uncharacterized protein n=1 Tax=Mucor mucedo TaxID=29922 RepID=UPI002220F0E1|nr:uncharacterized protein EV154DRAFT_600119 [Mucor mucedo]KAI7894231.1 hypothetical protein EV154DRAFT_600119 [Mucor mucedo]